jgi:hypothetical protein
MRKILGSPISKSTEQDWPELAKAWASAEVYMPELTKNVSNVGAMGPVSRNVRPLSQAYGVTGPLFKNISLNRKLVTEDDMLRDSLIHELTHANQTQTLGSLRDNVMLPWDKRPQELEAMASERNNPISQAKGDRNLPLRPGEKRDPRLGPSSKFRRKNGV